MCDDMGTNGMDNSFESFEFLSAPSGDADLSAADNSENLAFVGDGALYAADDGSVLDNGLGHGTFPAALETQLPREMMMQTASPKSTPLFPSPSHSDSSILLPLSPPAHGSVATGSSFAPAVPGLQGDHQDPPTNGLHVVPSGVSEDPFADITLETINAFNGPFNPIFDTHRILTTPMAPFGVPQASVIMPTRNTQQAAPPMMDWTNYPYEPTADHMMLPAAMPVDLMAYISPFHVPPAAAATFGLDDSSIVSASLGDLAYQCMVPRQMPVTNDIYQTPTGAQALNPDITQQTNHHISAAPQPVPPFVPSSHVLGNDDSSPTLNSSATQPAAKNTASKRRRQSADEGDKGSSLQVTDEDGETTACIIKNGKKIKVQLEDGEVVQEVQRVWIGCNECRRTRRKCNGLHVDRKEPCDRCIEGGIPCVYSDKERVHASKGKKKSPEEAAACRAKKEAQKIEDARLLGEGKSPKRKTKARMVIRSSPTKSKSASKKGKEREIEADTTSASSSDFSSPPASSFDEGSHFSSGD
ncbi:hypothetical protein L202_00977 [Cryptococcus amylolentus CBS 6039]|uniref:Zn(2)-C6 fungal-type domain-containing protein n=1 Tax=Cryptococcus amylolentus CBS 6039 TaxID=1295533 RepID=A0A1E3I268_9TREE|nr:hypothetical protein L202_00977 [Cryptococcus amylolentus CBS 6039]ODN82684.1 hypothetical protein L202_00977 [Cryptococcus amylolentus CBS 6039]